MTTGVITILKVITAKRSELFRDVVLLRIEKPSEYQADTQRAFLCFSLFFGIMGLRQQYQNSIIC